MTLQLIPDGDLAPQSDERQTDRRRGGGVQCACGRFAKHVSTRHWYNGTWNMITVTVRCSRCGEVNIECV